ncbi:hypothetical protein SAMN05421839_11173 [Halolactibacillus halophilus]|uniref:Uncharacterized protein n=1 Tax=Halolactibacillus halophilus TaxID=306540 RepID=A0A1I5NXA4_9BACI|nr:hypothetical protein [Halolactibacillus halophilus]GEM01491.1 hypothetical protein HHA03_10230 [Halolactibacillus halophilus]SFP26403.1 hypothetical protein SAMN05421839_11173 [Halolactibacillus halophilus]
MITNKKYTKPILLIIGLVLLNIYTFVNSEEEMQITLLILIVSVLIGLYKGINATEFREIFNLLKTENIFKGPMRKFELLASLLLCTSANIASNKFINMMSISNILFEIVVLFVFTFGMYRLLFLNLFKD